MTVTKKPSLERAKTITASYTLTGSDNTIIVDPTAGAIDITFPLASESNSKYTIKYENTINPVNLIASGSDIIESASPWLLASYTFQSDGVSNWYVIDSNNTVVPTSFSLNFDGINDYVINNASTPYTEWDETQPFTLFLNLEPSDTTVRIIFGNRLTGPSDGPGIVSGFLTGGEFFFTMRGSPTTSDAISLSTNAAITASKHTFAVTYDGSGLAGGVQIYVDGILASSNIIYNGLVSTIINGQGNMIPGADFAGSGGYPSYFGKIRWFSFVDYIKTPAEIAQDHLYGYQPKGTGNYLFAADFNRTSGLSFLSSDSASLTMDIQGQISGDRVLF